MTQVSTLHSPANAAVIGASGGIGGALVQLLAGDDRVGRVHAFSRTPVAWKHPRVAGRLLDLSDEASVEAGSCHASAHAPLDLVIIASGILHREPQLSPEKSLRDIEAQALAEVFAVNTIGPALVAKHFLPRLRHQHKSVLAALSARVGSISDNRLGGWFSYRMSKAALNMLLRTLAVEQARRLPQSVVVALHPGTVDTQLSRPFTSRLDAPQLFSPAKSAARLLQVIDGLRAEDSGGFFAYDGSRIEY